jgi:hypothetical protein
MTPPEKERRRLIVTGSRELSRGSGDHGEWVLYAVEATTVGGEPIRAKLVTFEDLEDGEVDVEVERTDHPQHGTSYRLRRVRPKLSIRVDQLERQVRELQDRLGIAT